jgi:hypothetical protein
MNTSLLWLLGSTVLFYLAWHCLHKAVFHSGDCRPSHHISEYFFYTPLGQRALACQARTTKRLHILNTKKPEYVPND